jgi:membrane-associated protein
MWVRGDLEVPATCALPSDCAVQQILDFIFHIDDHLKDMVREYGTGTYAVLFAIVFVETGVVIWPFLPGDSLLFAAGTLCAQPADGGPAPLNAFTLCLVLMAAAIIGDNVNYHIGFYLGPAVFKNPKSFWLNPKHLEKTHAYFEKYGGKTIILARFMPIVRTMAPFVAGIGKMNYWQFLSYSVVGGTAWVFGFVWLGKAFGNIELVQKNFEIVVLGIVGVSLLPMMYELLRHRFMRKADAKPLEPAHNEMAEQQQ